MPKIDKIVLKIEQSALQYISALLYRTSRARVCVRVHGLGGKTAAEKKAGIETVAPMGAEKDGIENACAEDPTATHGGAEKGWEKETAHGQRKKPANAGF